MTSRHYANTKLVLDLGLGLGLGLGFDCQQSSRTNLEPSLISKTDYCEDNSLLRLPTFYIIIYSRMIASIPFSTNIQNLW